MKNKKNQTYNSRRNFLKQAALGVAGGIVLQGGLPVYARSTETESDLSFGFTSKPVLTNIDSNRVEIIVVPNKLAAGWVEFGKTSQLGQKVESTIRGRYQFSDRVLRFTLDNLEPGTNYFYRVHLEEVMFHENWEIERTNEVTGDVYSFSTLNPENTTARFACWNDTHENEETLGRLHDLLPDQNPDFLIWNGDITNDIHREEQIVGQFLNPASLPFATNVPVMLARGNHDVRGRDAPYLEDYMAGPGGNYYFGFRQGPVAFLVMDTGEDKIDEHIEYGGLADFASYRSMQARWLEEVIKKPWFQSAPFRVVFMHIPLVWDLPNRYRVWDGKCSGWICEDAYDKWNQLLNEGDVQLVISGHTHQHRYIPPKDGRIYGQLVGGGPQPDRATCITGYADNTTMEITMTDLDGKILESLSYSV